MFSFNSIEFILIVWLSGPCIVSLATEPYLKFNDLQYMSSNQELTPVIDTAPSKEAIVLHGAVYQEANFNTGSELNMGTIFLTEPCTFYYTMTKFEDRHEETNYTCHLNGLDAENVGPYTMPIKINGQDPTNEMLADILHSGETTLFSLDACIDVETWVISFPKKIIIGNDYENDHENVHEHGRRRKLDSSTEGSNNVIVVRVISEADGDADIDDEATMSDHTFGTHGDDTTPKSQYNDVSFGKLILQPSQTLGTDGVLTVTITDTVQGVDHPHVQGLVDAEMSKLYGASWVTDHDIQHYIMILPSGTPGDWVAYAAIDGVYSVFNGLAYAYIGRNQNSMLMVHEIGHNLGLAHSGDVAGELFSGDSAVYDDTSCMMGGGFNEFELIGFNGPKSWQLGWYAGRYLSISREDGGGTFRLVGAVDYQNAVNDDMVVIQITGGNADDYYVAFNRKAGFNVDTNEGDGNVVMVTRRIPGTGLADSWLEAELGIGDQYSTEFDIGPLIIMVDHIDLTGSPAAYAQVTILFGTLAPSVSLKPTISPAPTFDPNKIYDLLSGQDDKLGTFSDMTSTYFDVEVQSDLHYQSISVLFKDATEEVVNCALSYRLGTWEGFEGTANFKPIYDGTFKKTQQLQKLPDFPVVPLSTGLHGFKLECSKEFGSSYSGPNVETYNTEDDHMRIKSGKYGLYSTTHSFDWKGAVHYVLRSFPSTAPSTSLQPSTTPYPTLAPSRSPSPSYDPASIFELALGNTGNSAHDYARAYFDLTVTNDDIQLIGMTVHFDSEAAETTSCQVYYRSDTADGFEGVLPFGTKIYDQEFTKEQRLQELPDFGVVPFPQGSYGVKIECSHSFEVRYRGLDVATINAEDANVQITSGAYGYYMPTYKFDLVGSIEYLLMVETQSPTASPTSGMTSSPTASPTNSPTTPPTRFPTSSPTKGPTQSPTSSPTKGPTQSPTTSPTKIPTQSPTFSPTKEPTQSPSTSPTKIPTQSPTTSPTTSPTQSPTTSPTTSPTQSPTDSPTKGPTQSPTTSPTKGPTQSPTASPTKGPTISPTTHSPTIPFYTEPPSSSRSPTKLPTFSPSKLPTGFPTTSPSSSPTRSPSKLPTRFPTTSPSSSPTHSPSKLPTRFPTNSPSHSPTHSPSKLPTRFPTNSPSHSPTSIPTRSPTSSPTRSPTKTPTRLPTASPTFSPSAKPSTAPSATPTLSPTISSTSLPTSSPSTSPTTSVSPTIAPKGFSTDTYDMEVSLTLEGEIHDERELSDFAKTKLDNDCNYIEGCVAFHLTETEITEVPITIENRQRSLSSAKNTTKIIKIIGEITYEQDAHAAKEEFATTASQGEWPPLPASAGNAKVASSSYETKRLERSTLTDFESGVSIRYVPSACKFPVPGGPPCYFRYTQGNDNNATTLSSDTTNDVYSSQHVSYWKQGQWSIASFDLKCCCQSTCYQVVPDKNGNIPRGGVRLLDIGTP